MARKRLFLIALALVAVAAGLGAYWPFRGRARELHLPGTVQSQEVRLGSKVSGRVVAVLVNDGDRVKAGQELVRLELPELDAQREQLQAQVYTMEAELRKARAGARPEELREAREALKAAEARWKRIKAGSRTEEIEQAREDRAAAEAERASAEDHYRRLRISRISTPTADLESAAFRRDRAVAVVASADARLRLLLAGNRPEEREEAEAERDRQQARLDLLLAGTHEDDIARAEAQVGNARARLREVETQLREAGIRAREAGRVEVVSVRPGDIAQANQPVVRMLRDGDLWVRAFVPEPLLGKLRLGQSVAVTIDSHPGTRFPGTIYYIASESEFTPRNVQSADERSHQVFAIKVRVEAPDGVFKSGMAAEIHVATSEAE